MTDLTPFCRAHCSHHAAMCVWFDFPRGRWRCDGCMWFIAREHTQAEYRWIAQLGAGKRANMPWWGGFDRRAWNLPSLLDWLVPVLACTAVYFVAAL